MISKASQWITKFSTHPHAKKILFGIAFLESWIFPLPPDLLLVPMVIQNPRQTWKLALGCSISSVLGGIIGYIIGYYFYSTLGESILHYYGLQDSFNQWKVEFCRWGVWIILLKGFLPIPYKIITLFSGLTHFNFWAFLATSAVVRSGRFFILSGICYRYGAHIRFLFDQYLGWIFLATCGFAIGGYFLVKCF